MSIGSLSLDDRNARRKTLERLSLAALVILFIIVYFVILSPEIRGTIDSRRYWEGGKNVAAGSALGVYKGGSYLGYIAMVAASISIGTGLYGIFAVQLVMGALAACALYDLGRSLGGHWAGVAASLLFIADTHLASYSSQIMTDYPYTAMIVILVWTVYKTVERGGFFVLLCLPVLLLTCTLRPNGMILLPIVVIYWIQCKVSDRRWRWAASIAVSVAFVLIVIVPSPLHTAVAVEDPLDSIRRGITVWAKPYWRVPMPGDPLLQQRNWSGVFLYIARHPLESGWLMLARLLIHFSNLRPDVSLVGNITSSLWLLWIYPLAVLGMIRSRRHPLLWLSLPIIVVHAGIIALTFASAGRFLFYTLPLFYLFSAASVTRPGIPTKDLKWMAIQLAGLAVIIVRLDVGPHSLVNRSVVAFANPSPNEATLKTAEISQSIRLVGFKPLPSPIQEGAGGSITFYWEAVGLTSRNYGLSVQMLDENGSLIGSMDQWLGGGFFNDLVPDREFTSTQPFGTLDWQSGLRMVDSFTITIPADSPHKLNVYLEIFTGKKKNPVTITPTSGQRVDANGMLLQTIEVSP